jgi:hypothetical protein
MLGMPTIRKLQIHHGLILCPNCVPEIVGANENDIFTRNNGTGKGERQSS